MRNGQLTMKNESDLTLRKMLHNFSALTELAEEISSTHNFAEVTRASLHTLLGALAIPRGVIARYTSKPRQIKIVAARGIAEAVGERIVVERDEAERFAELDGPILIDDEKHGLADFFHRNEDLLFRLRVRIAIPMLARGELMGLIFLSEKLTGR